MKKIVEHPRFGEITVMRTRRARRLSLSIRPPGVVRLTLPPTASMKEGMAFVAEKEEWIAATLKKVAQKHPVRIIGPDYRTPLRGLVFAPADTDKFVARISKDLITLTYPAALEWDSAQVQDLARKAIIQALKDEAKRILPGMVDELARRHGFRYGMVTVRATRSRWGSCSHENNISLSIFLLCVPQELCEYVILHELCHTRHKDHSPKFHKLLDSILEGREQELSKQMRAYRTDVI